jgi:hypothetical protein
MRKLFAVAWLIFPVGVLAYHFGPGQTGVAHDAVAAHLSIARAAEAKDDWLTAMKAYADAAAVVPDNEPNTRLKVRLAHARARMYAGELPEAMEDLEGVLTDAQSQNAPRELVNEIRSSVGSMHYYAAWLMRLEGAPAEEWTIETEQARQHFRLLAENAQAYSEPSDAHQKNLEATIRLARMDLSELKGLPLPKECKNCSNCSGKCRKQRESRTKVQKKGEGDARQEVQEDKQKGAGQNDRPEGSGS